MFRVSSGLAGVRPSLRRVVNEDWSEEEEKGVETCKAVKEAVPRDRVLRFLSEVMMVAMMKWAGGVRSL